MKGLRFVLLVVVVAAAVIMGKGVFAPVLAYADELVSSTQHEDAVNEVIVTNESSDSSSSSTSHTAEKKEESEEKEEKEEKVVTPESVSENKQEETEVDIPNIGTINFTNNMMGVLYIPSINLKEPVMQGTDNEYYLHHDINGDESTTGAIFLQAGMDPASASSFFVFGHNMKNGSMFGSLKTIKQASGQMVYLYTQKCVYVYQMRQVELRDTASDSISNADYADGDMVLYTCNGAAGGTEKRLIVCEPVTCVNN